MTNTEIIVNNMILNGVNEHVDTFAGWKARGYSIKKGSHALFKTKIWKPCVTKKSEDETDKKLILVSASFFGESQVEKNNVQ